MEGWEIYGKDLQGKIFTMDGEEVLHGLLLGPALRMQARVHDQTDRPPDFRAEPAESRVRVLIGARHLAREPLRVQSPAFRIGREARLPPERRHGRQLLRDRQLHMMPRQTFVIRDGFQLGLRHRRHL